MPRQKEVNVDRHDVTVTLKSFLQVQSLFSIEAAIREVQSSHRQNPLEALYSSYDEHARIAPRAEPEAPTCGRCFRPSGDPSSEPLHWQTEGRKPSS